MGAMTPRHAKNKKVLLGLKLGCLPFTYLVVPLFIGRPKKSFFNPIVDKVKQKL